MTPRHTWVLVSLLAACDSSDGGDTDRETFDPTFEGEAAGDYIPTAGASGATFTAGGNTLPSTSGPSTATSPTSLTSPGSSDDSSSGGGGSSTCRMPCVDSTQCESAEACLETADMGSICLPFECDSCFADGGICSSGPFDCSFDSCEVDPNSTCNDSCTDASQCGVGEDCIELTSGPACVPVECSQCFANELSCTWSNSDCTFEACVPPA